MTMTTVEATAGTRKRNPTATVTIAAVIQVKAMVKAEVVAEVEVAGDKMKVLKTDVGKILRRDIEIGLLGVDWR